MPRELVFSNELTIQNVGSLANELLNALQGGMEVSIDLSGVERIDTAALQVLIAAAREARIAGITMTCITSVAVENAAVSVGIQL